MRERVERERPDWPRSAAAAFAMDHRTRSKLLNKKTKPMFPFIAPESVVEAVEMAVVFFSMLAAMLGFLVTRQA